MQILYAEREFMAAQMKNANANGASLSKEVTKLKMQLAAAQESTSGGQLQEALLSQSSSSGSISNDIFADANRCDSRCNQACSYIMHIHRILAYVPWHELHSEGVSLWQSC